MRIVRGPYLDSRYSACVIVLMFCIIGRNDNNRKVVKNKIIENITLCGFKFHARNKNYSGNIKSDLWGVSKINK